MDITTAKRLIDALTTDLSARGFTVQARGRVVTVKNPGAKAGSDSVYGQVLNHGLQQTVILQPRNGREGALWWFWEWPGPSRQEPPDYEPLCPGTQVTEAADRISKVLALRPEPASTKR